MGDLIAGRPRDIHLVYSQHRCTRCRKYFNADMSDYALPKAHYTDRVVALAVRLVVEDGLPYQAASWHLWRDHRVFVPLSRLPGTGPVQFRASIQKQKVLPALIGRFVEGVLGGSAEPLVAYLAGSDKLSAKDLETLRSICRKLDKELEEP